MKIFSSLFLTVVIGFWSQLALAQFSGICDCQIVECAPDTPKPLNLLCLWLSTKRTVQVISVNVEKPEMVVPTCRAMESTVDFGRLPNMNYEDVEALLNRRAMVVCEELRFF